MNSRSWLGLLALLIVGAPGRAVSAPEDPAPSAMPEAPIEAAPGDDLTATPQPEAAANPARVVELFLAGRWAEAEALAAPLRPTLSPRDALMATLEPALDAAALAALPLDALESAGLGPWLHGLARRSLESCAARACEPALGASRRLLGFLPEAEQAEAIAVLALRQGEFDAWAAPDPGRIGVLLPLTGPHASFGLAARRALELVIPTGIHLDFRDTSGDAAAALTAARTLVFDARAIAIIGPIGRLETAAVVRFLRAWDIPHLPLATAVDPPEGGQAIDPVLRLRTSPAELASALATHARMDVGLTRVAILLPDTPLAREQGEAFAETFTRLGGTLVRTVTFDATKPDEALQTLLNLTSKKAKVDFDGLFFPADVAVVRRLLPMLTKKGLNLRLAPDPSPAKGSPRVQLLGGLGWSTAQLVDHTDRLTENAIFPEVFVPEADAPQIQAFVARFTSLYKERPSALQADAFDALTVLTRVLRPDDPPATARAALISRLFEPWTLAGVTGILTLSNGRLAPRVQLRTLDGTRIRARLGESEERALRGGAPLLETPARPPMGPVR